MQKIAVIYEASQAVLSTFDLDEILRHILSILNDQFRLQHTAVLLLDSGTQQLVIRAHSGPFDNLVNSRISLGEGLIGTAAERKRPLYCPNVSEDPNYISSILSTRSELCIPLMLRNEMVGVLDCQSDQIDFFDSETIELLRLFSTQASIAIQNAQLHALERRRAIQLEAINAVARHTTAVTELRELLGKICMLIVQSFPADHVAVLLRERKGLVLSSHCGRLTPRMNEGDALPAEPGLCQQALATNAPVLVRDVQSAASYIPGFVETRSELVLPLISFGEAIGVLTLESAQVNGFQPADISALESVADICAAAIQNANYVEQVRQLAYRDGLTGVFNRRYFESRILEEIERANRYDSPLALIMIDIDEFKPLNDDFGHLVGDEVLKQVSTIFLQQTRKVDMVCRYGGDEFAIILPETTAPNAMAVAEKLLRVVAEARFPGVSRPVSLSAGIAELPLHGRTRNELVKVADRALYSAKQAGRNRVVLAPDGCLTICSL